MYKINSNRIDPWDTPQIISWSDIFSLLLIKTNCFQLLRWVSNHSINLKIFYKNLMNYCFKCIWQVGLQRCPTYICFPLPKNALNIYEMVYFGGLWTRLSITFLSVVLTIYVTSVSKLSQFMLRFFVLSALRRLIFVKIDFGRFCGFLPNPRNYVHTKSRKTSNLQEFVHAKLLEKSLENLPIFFHELVVLGILWITESVSTLKLRCLHF